MLPFVVILSAVVFLILKISGILDDFTNAMRGFWETRDGRIREIIKELSFDNDADDRLEVFREFLSDKPDTDEDV
jgi:hypothetical protein